MCLKSTPTKKRPNTIKNKKKGKTRDMTEEEKADSEESVGIETAVTEETEISPTMNTTTEAETEETSAETIGINTNNKKCPSKRSRRNKRSYSQEQVVKGRLSSTLRKLRTRL